MTGKKFNFLNIFGLVILLAAIISKAWMAIRIQKACKICFSLKKVKVVNSGFKGLEAQVVTTDKLS